MLDARFKKQFQAAETQRAAGGYEAALEGYEACLPLLEKASAPKAFALVWFRISKTARALGRWADAASALGNLTEDIVLPGAIRVEAAESLARLQMEYATPSEARAAIDDALDLSEKEGATASRARLFGNLGVLALREGDFGTAKRNLVLSAEAFGGVSDLVGQAQAWAGLGEVALRAGHTEQAVEFFDDAYRMLLELGAPKEAAVPRAAMGHLYRRSGHSYDAHRVYGEVCEIFEGEGEHAAGASVDLALSYMDLGDWVRADIELRRAEDFATSDLHRARAQYARADWLGERGELSRARAAAQSAHDLFARAMDTRGAEAAILFSARLAWRSGVVAPLQSLPSTLSAMPDLRLAYDAQMAERFFLADRLEEALAIAQPFAQAASGGVDRVQHLKAEAYMAMLMWMLDRGDIEAFSQTILTIVHDLNSGGNIRDAVGVGLSHLPLLILRNALPQAAHLLGLVQSFEVDSWPRGWRRALARNTTMLALATGEAVQVPPDPDEPVEDLSARILDGICEAISLGDMHALQGHRAQLEETGRNLWSRLIGAFLRAIPKVLRK